MAIRNAEKVLEFCRKLFKVVPVENTSNLLRWFEKNHTIAAVGGIAVLGITGGVILIRRYRRNNSNYMPEYPPNYGTGNTRLHKILLEPNKPYEIIQSLLENRIYNREVDSKNDNEETPLHLATANLRADVMALLLEKYHANPNNQDVKGNTPLHLLLSKLDNINKNTIKPLINLLLKHHADTNLENNNGEAALALAGKTNDLDIVKLKYQPEKALSRYLHTALSIIGVVAVARFCWSFLKKKEILPIDLSQVKYLLSD